MSARPPARLISALEPVYHRRATAVSALAVTVSYVTKPFRERGLIYINWVN